MFSPYKYGDDKDEQYHVLFEGLPWFQMNRVPKATAIGHFIKISGIEREKTEKYNHDQ